MASWLVAQEKKLLELGGGYQLEPKQIKCCTILLQQKPSNTGWGKHGLTCMLCHTNHRYKTSPPGDANAIGVSGISIGGGSCFPCCSFYWQSFKEVFFHLVCILKWYFFTKYQHVDIMFLLHPLQASSLSNKFSSNLTFTN